jgi:hypothetical protein
VQKRDSSFQGADLLFGSIEPDYCAGWAVGLEPCASWESAWLELLELGLMDLPDSTELPGEQSVEDGVAYVIELQSQGKYRTYHYSNPNDQTWPEARRIEKIIDVVGRRIRCDQHRARLEQRGWNGRTLIGQLPSVNGDDASGLRELHSGACRE